MEFDPEQRRRAITAFMNKVGIKVRPWETASGMSGGTLRKFMNGQSESMNERTMVRLAVGATKLVGRDVDPNEFREESPVSNARIDSSVPHLDVTSEERQQILPAPPLPVREPKTRDPGIPVLGTGLAGREGDFQMNHGEIDRVATPSHLKNRRDLFILYVEGTSMIPWKRPQQMVWLDPHIRPQINDHVVVELNPSPPDEDKPAFLKLLVRKTPTKLTLRQYSPERTFDVPLSRVYRIYRVMTEEEVLGIGRPLF